MTETKWEYKVLQSPWWGLQKVNCTFNKLGEGGWELVTIDRDIAYFKRPVSIAISDSHRDLGEVEELNE